MSHSIFALFYLHKRIKECKSLAKLAMPLILDSTNEYICKNPIHIDIYWKTNRKVVNPLTTECSTKGKTVWQTDAGGFQLIFIWEKAKTVINYRFPKGSLSGVFKCVASKVQCGHVFSFTVKNCFRGKLMMSSAEPAFIKDCKRNKTIINWQSCVSRSRKPFSLVPGILWASIRSHISSGRGLRIVWCGFSFALSAQSRSTPPPHLISSQIIFFCL